MARTQQSAKRSVGGRAPRQLLPPRSTPHRQTARMSVSRKTSVPSAKDPMPSATDLPPAPVWDRGDLTPLREESPEPEPPADESNPEANFWCYSCNNADPRANVSCDSCTRSVCASCLPVIKTFSSIAKVLFQACVFRCPPCHHSSRVTRYTPYFGLYYKHHGRPYFPNPVEFKGPLYNGHAAVVNTSSLALLSFTIPSQVPYAPVAAHLDASLRPYFIPTSYESADADDDNSDDDEPVVESDPFASYSGQDSDSDDARSAMSVDDPVLSPPEDRYIYRALTFNLYGYEGGIYHLGLLKP